MMKRNSSVSVIVPVYGDWSSLAECIDSLKVNVLPPNKVILVNDRGPEYQNIEKKIKKSIAGLSNFEYYLNDVNLGFLQNCNKAVTEYDKTSNDIILLNSDTKPTEGFIEELRAVAYSDRKIATVCPRSNEATIASMPMRLKDVRHRPTSIESYNIFKRFSSMLPRYYIAPVSVGFCFYVKREVIVKHGLFDEIYKKGYGEEDDFCMRMNELGYISAIANRAFVFHQGARSFTPALRSKLANENTQVLLKRFPFFSEIVRKYLEYPICVVENFSDTLYKYNSENPKKIMIDLHSLPPTEIGYTEEVRGMLEKLKDSAHANFTVVTSSSTREYLKIKNQDISWVEPHLVTDQYDFSYSLMPLTNLNNAKLLKDVAVRNIFHPRCKAYIYKNRNKIDDRMYKINEIFIEYAYDFIHQDLIVSGEIWNVIDSNIDYDKLQRRWEKLNIIFILAENFYYFNKDNGNKSTLKKSFLKLRQYLKS